MFVLANGDAYMKWHGARQVSVNRASKAWFIIKKVQLLSPFHKHIQQSTFRCKPSPHHDPRSLSQWVKLCKYSDGCMKRFATNRKTCRHICALSCSFNRVSSPVLTCSPADPRSVRRLRSSAPAIHWAHTDQSAACCCTTGPTDCRAALRSSPCFADIQKNILGRGVSHCSSRFRISQSNQQAV